MIRPRACSSSISSGSMPRSAGKLPTANSRMSSGLTCERSAIARYVTRTGPGRALVRHTVRFAQRSDAFDDHRLALTPGDAHRLQADLLVIGLQPVQERPHDAGAGHPEGVAEGDRPAVRV